MRRPVLVLLPVLPILACLLAGASCPGTLDGPDPVVAALDEIRRLEDRRTNPAGRLDAYLRHDDPLVRTRAARAVGRLGGLEAVASLSRPVEQDPDPQVARAAALGIGLARRPEGLPVLSRALERRSEPEVRAACLQAMGLIAHGASTAVRRARSSGTEDPDAARTLAAMQDRVPPGTVTARLDDAAAEVRREACLCLFRMHRVDAAGDLAAVLGDADLEVRRAAAYALGRLQPTDDGPWQALRRAADDADPEVRAFSLRGLVGREGPEVRAVLVDALDDADLWVRVDALGLLRRVGTPEDVDAVTGSAVAGSVHERSEAAVTLGRLGRAAPDGADERAVARDALQRLVNGPAPMVRGRAIPALADLRGPDALPAVERALADESVQVRGAAADALGVIAAPRAGELVIERYRAEPEAIVRARLVAAAGAHTDDGTAATMVRMGLAEDDLAVRTLAAELAGTTARADWVPLLSDAYDDSPGRTMAEARQAILGATERCARMGDPFVPGAITLLRKGMRDPSHAVRVQAARSLSNLTGGAVPPASEGVDATETFFPGAGTAPLAGDADDRPRVRVVTERGTLVLELRPDLAPTHVQSFLRLVDDGFYDGLRWHRVVPGFVIQGGCPRGDGWGGPGWTLRAEFSGEPYRRGTLGMARSSDPHTAGSQFFVTHRTTPHLTGNYTVFGRVVSGLDVIDRVRQGDRITRMRVIRR